MNKGRLGFVWLALIVLLLQAGCSKKAVPVSGSEGLAEESIEAPIMDSDPLVMDSGGLSEEPMGFADSGDSMMAEERMMTEKAEEMPAEVEKAQDLSEALEDVFFDFDRASLGKASKDVLQKNARHLVLNPGTKVQIEGHTDERGNNEYNLALGARRARAVKRFLEALGVESSRIKIISFGEEKPFCTESAEHCWKMNRRAHFKAQS